MNTKDAVFTDISAVTIVYISLYSLTLYLNEAPINDFANWVDPDQAAHEGLLIRAYSVCFGKFDIWSYTSWPDKFLVYQHVRLFI